MPLSLKLPEGFIPSYWSHERAGVEADVPADLVGALEQGLAFADRDDLSGGAKGRSSRNRQTPEKLRGRARSAHLASNSSSRRGTGSRSQS